MIHQKPTPRRPLNNNEHGLLAEILVSDQRYRDALNAPYASGDPEDIDKIHAHESETFDLMSDVIKSTGIKATPELRAWEAGRQAVLAGLGNRALGSFKNYFLGVDSIPLVPEAEPDYLPEGDPNAVATNSRIVKFASQIDDPVEFIDTALNVIDRQKQYGHDTIGPENYATAMKIFTDKYTTLERDTEQERGTGLPSLPDMADVRAFVNEALGGFLDVAQRDKPNYIEMTNIFAAIRGLPKGVVDKKFTRELLIHATRNLDQYDKLAGGVLLGALPKIDTSGFASETAAIVNLVLHRKDNLSTTGDLRTIVRAIDTLKKDPQTDAALDSFFELAEGFSQPLDLEGIDEVIDRFKHITNDITEDKALTMKTKEFTSKCMARANQLTRQMLAGGKLTEAQLDQLKQTYGRIKSNYQAI